MHQHYVIDARAVEDTLDVQVVGVRGDVADGHDGLLLARLKRVKRPVVVHFAALLDVQALHALEHAAVELQCLRFALWRAKLDERLAHLAAILVAYQLDVEHVLILEELADVAVHYVGWHVAQFDARLLRPVAAARSIFKRRRAVVVVGEIILLLSGGLAEGWLTASPVRTISTPKHWLLLLEGGEAWLVAHSPRGLAVVVVVGAGPGHGRPTTYATIDGRLLLRALVAARAFVPLSPTPARSVPGVALPRLVVLTTAAAVAASLSVAVPRLAARAPSSVSATVAGPAVGSAFLGALPLPRTGPLAVVPTRAPWAAHGIILILLMLLLLLLLLLLKHVLVLLLLVVIHLVVLLLVLLLLLIVVHLLVVVVHLLLHLVHLVVLQHRLLLLLLLLLVAHAALLLVVGQVLLLQLGQIESQHALRHHHLRLQRQVDQLLLRGLGQGVGQVGWRHRWQLLQHGLRQRGYWWRLRHRRQHMLLLWHDGCLVRQHGRHLWRQPQHGGSSRRRRLREAGGRRRLQTQHLLTGSVNHFLHFSARA